MARRLIISPSAHQDMCGIIDFISLESPHRALSFITELQARMTNILLTFPNSGKVYKSGTRYIVIERYVAVYQDIEASDTVAILHIYGGGEDWKVK